MFEMRMGKTKIRAKLISNDDNLDINTTGIKTNNKIIYKEGNVQVTLLIFDNKIEMKRETKEYIIELLFDKSKNTESTYMFIGGNKKFYLNTKTNKIVINENKIEIDYELEDNKFSYVVEMEDL